MYPEYYYNFFLKVRKISRGSSSLEAKSLKANLTQENARDHELRPQSINPRTVKSAIFLNLFFV